MNVNEKVYYKSNYSDTPFSLELIPCEKNDNSTIYKTSLQTLKGINQAIDNTVSVKIGKDVVDLKNVDGKKKLTDIAKGIAATYRREHQDGAIVKFFKNLFGIKGKAEKLEELCSEIENNKTEEIAKRRGFDPEKFKDHASPIIFLRRLYNELETLNQDDALKKFVKTKEVKSGTFIFTRKSTEIDAQETLNALSQLNLEQLQQLLVSPTPRPFINSFLMKQVVDGKFELSEPTWHPPTDHEYTVKDMFDFAKPAQPLYNVGGQNPKTMAVGPGTLNTLFEKGATEGRWKVCELAFLLIEKNRQNDTKNAPFDAVASLLSKRGHAYEGQIGSEQLLDAAISLINRGSKLTTTTLKSIATNIKISDEVKDFIIPELIMVYLKNKSTTNQEEIAQDPELNKYLDLALFQQAKKGDKEAITFLVDHFFEGHLNPMTSYFLLSGAILGSQTDTIKFLFEKKANPFAIFKNQPLLELAKFKDAVNLGKGVQSKLGTLISEEIEKQIATLSPYHNLQTTQTVEAIISLALDKNRPDILNYLIVKEYLGKDFNRTMAQELEFLQGLQKTADEKGQEDSVTVLANSINYLQKFTPSAPPL